MIGAFRGDYRFLSNFWPARVNYEGMWFPSVEHAYQAAKTLDRESRLKVAGMKANEAKAWGGKVALRPDWENIKLVIMEELLVQKFAAGELHDKLLTTEGHTLVEGNTWHDRWWGVCLCAKCDGKPGQNHLGKLLMKIRERLKQEQLGAINAAL